MATDAKERERLTNELRTKAICRFCLTQQHSRLGSIFVKDARLKATAPLTLQVMACASMEVMNDDGMPSKICSECRVLFEFSYRFKQMCKKSDTLLRQVPLTGVWPAPLPRPKYPLEYLKVMDEPEQRLTNTKRIVSTSHATASPTPMTAKKLLNSNPVASPEPPAPKRMKKEKLDVETEETIFLNKVENDEELSIDDVQRLIAASAELPLTEDGECDDMPEQPAKKPKPVVLNKMKVRILNKEADQSSREPRFSVPQLKCDAEGNVEIVTEVLDPNKTYDADDKEAIKKAEPVETNVFPCPHCERSFPLVQLRDIHVVNHNRERSFQCPDCEKSFFSKYDLQKHSLTHTGDRPFKCTACYKSFTRATLLHRHEKVHTDVPKFICVYCEKPFISKEEMEKHTERHRKKRPFQCKVCDKSFAFKQGLDRHEVIHMRDQPYPCQYCESSFSTPSKLARHLTAHAGKRPYPCKFCAKSYLLSHHLTRHLRSHKAGKVTFDCYDCRKSFKTRESLVAHSEEHLHETTACPLCKELFNGIDEVTQHIKKHAHGEAYACEFCDLFFLDAMRLSEHIQQDHVVDMKAYQDDNKPEVDVDADEPEEDNPGKSVSNVDEEFLLEDDTIEVRSYESIAEAFNENDKKLPTISPKKPPSPVARQSLKRKATRSSTLNDDVSREGEQQQEEEQKAAPPPQAVKRSSRILASRRSGGDLAHQSVPKQKEPIHIEKNIVLSMPTKRGIKTEKGAGELKQPLIDKVLNSLPKGLSVRKNAPGPAGTSSATTTPVGKAEREKVKASNAQSTGKIDEIIVNNKKVKVQRVLMSKSEADAMAKEGRICVQDGNMLFTSNSKK